MGVVGQPPPIGSIFSFQKAAFCRVKGQKIAVCICDK